jgi:branched-chain amino acid transport system ATP-binding protein
MTAILRVERVAKHFGGVRAVDDVSFSVDRNEIVGLIGANGAGKTTLFSMVAGQNRPSSGEIYLFDRRIDGLPPHRINRLGVARTFQIVRPFRALSVLENVMVGVRFGAARTGAAKDADAAAEAWQILEETGLHDRAAMPAGALTLAGYKRLEVAKALATRPQLLLLDEVFAGLTPAESDAAIQLLRTVHRSRSLSIVLVEHVLKVVMQLCHHVVVLNNGKKIADGPPDAVRNDPAVIDSYLGEQR